MENENYCTIQGWMINVLGLKGNELILFAIIYGFSQDGKSKYHGSLSYIQKSLKVSRPTAVKLIRSLIDKKIIKRASESHYEAVKKLYQQKIGSKETLLVGSKETLPLPSKETLPNKYNTNNNTNNNIATKVAVNEMIDLFKSVNPSFERLFKNTTQRSAIERMTKQFGGEKLKKLIELLEKTNKLQYAPSITTPLQLEQKMGSLKVFLEKRQEEANKNKAIIL